MLAHLATGRRTRRRALVLTLVGLGVATSASAASSLALFTSSAAAGANAFDTGTITLGINPTSAVLTASGMMPGDTVKGSLVVSNNGSSQLRYAMTSSSTNADNKSLAGQLVLTVKTLGTSCAAFDGTTVYSNALSTAAFGDVTPGGQTGDRSLNAASSETLCFQANLPLATGNAFQGAATTSTFTFSAEQTANNP